MTPVADSDRWDELFRQAQAGSEVALGRLLDAHRPYLLWMANAELDADLLAKGGASDLVQETLLNAHRARLDFRGRSLDELLAWLRQILRNHLANFRRHYQQTEKRDVGREVPLDRVPDDALPADTRSPDQEAMLAERMRRLERAMGRLSPDDREIVVWRNLELLPFKEIAGRRGVTERAAQKQWTRAVLALEKLLAETT